MKVTGRAGRGLGGLPQAIEATWPKAIVQRCVVHYPDTARRTLPTAESECLVVG